MNADKFLRDQKIMRLGTVSKDGVPHVVPVWYSVKNFGWDKYENCQDP